MAQSASPAADQASPSASNAGITPAAVEMRTAFVKVSTMPSAQGLEDLAEHAHVAADGSLYFSETKLVSAVPGEIYALAKDVCQAGGPAHVGREAHLRPFDRSAASAGDNGEDEGKEDR